MGRGNRRRLPQTVHYTITPARGPARPQLTFQLADGIGPSVEQIRKIVPDTVLVTDLSPSPGIMLTANSEAILVDAFTKLADHFKWVRRHHS